jgi:hypothetical protein
MNFIFPTFCYFGECKNTFSWLDFKELKVMMISVYWVGKIWKKAIVAHFKTLYS